MRLHSPVTTKRKHPPPASRLRAAILDQHREERKGAAHGAGDRLRREGRARDAVDLASEAELRAEAIEWAKRCPGSPNEVIEVRQVQEMEDFPPDVQEAAAGFSEMQRQAREK